MSTQAMNESDTRRIRVYTKNERALIDIHKDDYQAAGNSDQRKLIATTRVFHALCAYWDSIKEVYNREDRLDDLLYWVRNTWRKIKVSGEVKPQTGLLNVKKSDVVWRTMKLETNNEIDTILGPEDASNARKRFVARTTAIGNLIGRMNSEETAKLEADVERLSHQGYSEDLRRQLVEKHYENRLNTSSKQNWLELGMLSITFTAFENTSGRLQVETHDRIAEHLQLTDSSIKSFEETHPEKVLGIQLVVLEYVRDMLVHYRGTEVKTVAQDNVIAKDSMGFPRLNPNYKREGLTKMTAETLYRDYLSAQYFMATNRRSDQAPYTQMVKDISLFVDKEYFPPDFVFRDPRNTRLSPILAFLDHIAEREQILPAEQVFRFHNVTTTRKGLDLEPSCYPDELDSRNPPAKKPSRKRKTSKNMFVNSSAADMVSHDSSTSALGEESSPTASDGENALNGNAITSGDINTQGNSLSIPGSTPATTEITGNGSGIRNALTSAGTSPDSADDTFAFAAHGLDTHSSENIRGLYDGTASNEMQNEQGVFDHYASAGALGFPPTDIQTNNSMNDASWNSQHSMYSFNQAPNVGAFNGEQGNTTYLGEQGQMSFTDLLNISPEMPGNDHLVNQSLADSTINLAPCSFMTSTTHFAPLSEELTTGNSILNAQSTANSIINTPNFFLKPTLYSQIWKATSNPASSASLSLPPPAIKPRPRISLPQATPPATLVQQMLNQMPLSSQMDVPLYNAASINSNTIGKLLDTAKATTEGSSAEKSQLKPAGNIDAGILGTERSPAQDAGFSKTVGEIDAGTSSTKRSPAQDAGSSKTTRTITKKLSSKKARHSSNDHCDQAAESSKAAKSQSSRGTKRHLTSDDLAAKEAEEIPVLGKRISKRRILG